MTQERLDGVVLGHVHQFLVDKVDLSKIADNFIHKNDSCVATFGKPVQELNPIFEYALLRSKINPTVLLIKIKCIVIIDK